MAGPAPVHRWLAHLGNTCRVLLGGRSRTECCGPKESGEDGVSFSGNLQSEAGGDLGGVLRQHPSVWPLACLALFWVSVLSTKLPCEVSTEQWDFIALAQSTLTPRGPEPPTTHLISLWEEDTPRSLVQTARKQQPLVVSGALSCRCREENRARGFLGAP